MTALQVGVSLLGITGTLIGLSEKEATMTPRTTILSTTHQPLITLWWATQTFTQSMESSRKVPLSAHKQLLQTGMMSPWAAELTYVVDSVAWLFDTISGTGWLPM